MCQQAKVLMAMAGPFMKCGLPIVAACVKNSTHYVDITGEFQFIRQAIEAFHEEAEKKKVAIVTTCGFDCVPSDIGSLAMHQYVREATKGEDAIASMAGYFSLKGAGQASGGTAHSIANLFRTMSIEDISSLCLVPKPLRRGMPTPMQCFIGFDKAVGQFTSPFIMAGGNERIVRRSNALLGRGQSSYYEAAVTKSVFEAVGNFIAVAAIGIFMGLPPLRYLTTKFLLPKQGDGPTEAQKKGAGYRATFIAKTKQGRTFKGVWADDRNPYDSTAIFVVESALAILDQIEKKDGTGPINGGVITPAVAFGGTYLNNLLKNGSGITFTVAEEEKDAANKSK